MNSHWYSRAGLWFWAALTAGLALRFYFVFFTEGTQDVEIWERHARDVLNRGLLGYYHVDPSANHPPFITNVEASLLRASDATGIPFRILLRAPFALLDLATTFLLLLILGDCRWRFLAAAGYWLNPISIIFSSYHGNTDCSIAFFLILCAWLCSKQKLLAAAVALGVSIWIKLPTILAFPAFVFFVPKWSERFRFAALAAFVGLAGYVPALFQDPQIIWQNVFGYRAQLLHTTAGIPTWGPSVVFFSIIASPQSWPLSFRPPIIFFLINSWLIGLALVLLLVWLRRSQRETSELCATIGQSYVIVLALGGFSFQYFAWSLPFWFFLPRWFFIPAIALVSAYVYCLYAVLCGNPWLVGFWDFSGHPYWPGPINLLRNVAYLLFCAGAIWFVISAILERRIAKPLAS